VLEAPVRLVDRLAAIPCTQVTFFIMSRGSKTGSRLACRSQVQREGGGKSHFGRNSNDNIFRGIKRDQARSSEQRNALSSFFAPHIPYVHHIPPGAMLFAGGFPDLTCADRSNVCSAGRLHASPHRPLGRPQQATRIVHLTSFGDLESHVSRIIARPYRAMALPVKQAGLILPQS